MDQIPEPPGSPRLLRPRSVSEILTDAFDLYRRHWQNLIVIVAVIVIPLSFAQVLLGGLTREGFRNGTKVVSGALIASALASLVVGITSILMWTVLTGAISRAAAGTFLGRDLEIGESYRYGLARFWSIVLIGVLSALAIAGGFILLIVPGFIVLARLTCVIPVLVIENRRGREALRRSWDLARGFGWPVFWTIIVAGLLTGLVNVALTAPFGDNWAARSLAASIASVLTTPYTAIVCVFIYLDLRVRKEQYQRADLERELASSST
jgi:uncharacterized membrane protein (DUF485 family)